MNVKKSQLPGGWVSFARNCPKCNSYIPKYIRLCPGCGKHVRNVNGRVIIAK